jgi:hypothetical protein
MLIKNHVTYDIMVGGGEADYREEVKLEKPIDFAQDMQEID